MHSSEVGYECYPMPAPSGSSYFNCYCDDLKGAVLATGLEWTLEGGSDGYYALTTISRSSVGVYVIVFHRKRIATGTVPHEVSHIAEHLKLDGEKRADFIDYYSNLTYIQILANDYELYVPFAGEELNIGIIE